MVMAAQMLSSIADNALLIAAIALIADLHGPAWMVPMMKWWFALAYVVLAAFVGAISDSFPKGRVMLMTNAIKFSGCALMFAHSYLFQSDGQQLMLVFVAYTIVGIGAAAYSPAKYGIVTEMLSPQDLVKGNSWIEGLTIISIIGGTLLGGWLTDDHVYQALKDTPYLTIFTRSHAEATIAAIGLIYIAAGVCNMLIPRTNVRYSKQETRPLVLIRDFKFYVLILWRDKLGQISLAVTTLFWGAGATLQLIVIEWGAHNFGYDIQESTKLMGTAALGTVLGAVLASRVSLRKSLKVLPMGVLMGLTVLLMPIVKSPWAIYGLLLMIGALSGYFVVPMNALLQHRGHVLLSAGHSIAVQNFNEQLNILLMLGVYSFMLWLKLPINAIIVVFGLLVASLMLVFIRWNRYNHRRNPRLSSLIGQKGHGRALAKFRIR